MARSGGVRRTVGIGSSTICQERRYWLNISRAFTDNTHGIMGCVCTKTPRFENCCHLKILLLNPMSYVILFGAGASYGAERFGMPPLGAALFDALRQFNPDGWGKIGEPLAGKFRSDFEAGMIALSSCNQFSLPILQRAMAAFFFRFAPTTENLYVELARRIRAKQWSGSIATLNYERLLEISLLHVGVQPTLNMGASNNGGVELCMPHGCCHLFCESVRGMADGVSFSGMDVTTNGPVVAISNKEQFWDRIRRDAFPPVMSYFEPQKRTTSGVNLMADQRNRWNQLCATATTIAIVGVHPRVHDSHIWGPLSSAFARIVFCGGPEGGTAFEAWKRATNRTNTSDTILDGYFAGEFNNLCASIGL